MPGDYSINDATEHPCVGGSEGKALKRYGKAAPAPVAATSGPVGRPKMGFNLDLGFDADSHGAPQTLVNCSLCTAAAVINHQTGASVTSGGVARRLQPGGAGPGSPSQSPELLGLWQLRNLGGDIRPLYDGSYSVEDSYDELGNPNAKPEKGTLRALQAQVDGMYYFCKRELRNPRAQFLGNVVAPVRLQQASSWMASFPIRTSFAVLVTSNTNMGVGHWNFALVANDRAVFIDYQTERVAASGPSVVAEGDRLLAAQKNRTVAERPSGPEVGVVRTPLGATVSADVPVLGDKPMGEQRLAGPEDRVVVLAFPPCAG